MTIYHATLVFVLLAPPPPAPPSLRLHRTVLRLHLPSMSAPPTPPTAHSPPTVEVVPPPYEPFYMRSISPLPSPTAPNLNSTPCTTAPLIYRPARWWCPHHHLAPPAPHPVSVSVTLGFNVKLNAHSMCTHESSLHTYRTKNGYIITNVIIYSIYYRIMSLQRIKSNTLRSIAAA
jgi:hypothetical protein